MQCFYVGLVFLGEVQTFFIRFFVALGVDEEKNGVRVSGCELGQLRGLPCARMVGQGAGADVKREKYSRGSNIAQGTVWIHADQNTARVFSEYVYSVYSMYTCARMCLQQTKRETYETYRCSCLTCVAKFTNAQRTRID